MPSSYSLCSYYEMPSSYSLRCLALIDHRKARDHLGLRHTLQLEPPALFVLADFFLPSHGTPSTLRPELYRNLEKELYRENRNSRFSSVATLIH